MRSKLSGIPLLMLAVLLLLPASALAHDRGRWSGRHYQRSWNRGRPVIVVRSHRPHYRPYGWDRGRKVGWRGCDLPPGLAQKYGCRGAFYRTRRYYRGYPVISIPLDDRGRYRIEFLGGY